MLGRVIIIPLLVAFLISQTRILLNAQASVVPASDLEYEIARDENSLSSDEQITLNGNSITNVTKSRQLAEEDNIDVDGPYGYVPRVVHGVRKIVKGLLNGSVHTIMHGAFGIAPEDVADDLIGTYNRIMGIPDPDDLPEREPTKKPTTVKPKTNGNSTESSKPNKKGTKKGDDDDDIDDDDDDLDDLDEKLEED